MHEKHLQKTHMLNEVADQWSENLIKFLSPAGTPPTPQQSKSLTQPPDKPVLRQERVNKKQADMKTLTLNPPSKNNLVLVGNYTRKEYTVKMT